ncbi:ATP-binding protein [Silicimonas sp. MF1-12-2]|jgi:serine/threonine-protein kinase RsbW|uniref:ATP-binding protein n=1 Tax=Silicimonas sp. MF1-12-2 TaxID=3384793 RepID=UPI0039B6466D
MPNETAVDKSTGETPGRLPHGLVSQMSFKATFRWVRRAIHEAMDALEAYDLTAEEMGSVEIVLAEALNNIVEHAYPQDQPGEITMSLRLRQTGLLVEISDRGKPMPHGRAPLGNHPMAEFGEDPMPEGGYGWYLIRELVQDLVYDRRDGQNILIFRLTIRGGV